MTDDHGRQKQRGEDLDRTIQSGDHGNPPKIQVSLVGREFGGRYRILKPLARGGMGIVYLAEQVKLGRTVVFKILSSELSNDTSAVARFEREARGLSALEHPNVVGIYDYGHEQELTYIVMEYVEGDTLARRLKTSGRLDANTFCTLARQILDGVAAAHLKGIVHRDIKPANIMVSSRVGQGDVAKVLDFGLAREVEASHDVTRGRIVGTISYLAPEVITGSPATPRSDVYSLGVMFFQMLTGRRPFEGADEISIMYQHVNTPSPRIDELLPGQVPSDLCDIIHRCLAKNPDERPADAAELRSEFGTCVSMVRSYSWGQESTPNRRYATPAKAPTPPIFEHPQRSTSARQPSLKPWMIGGVTFAVVLAAFWAVVQIVTSPTAPETTVTQPVIQTTPKTDTVQAPSMPPKVEPALVEISSSAPARIFIDGLEQGTTPRKMEISPGRHLIALSAEGFEVWEKWLDVEPGENKSLVVSLVTLTPQDQVKPKRTVKKFERTQPVASQPEPDANLEKTDSRKKSTLENPIPRSLLPMK